MLNLQNQALLELMVQRFGAVPEECAAKLQAVEDETDFDLELWSLAHRLKVDTEELLRQLGERWALSLAEDGFRFKADRTSMLQSLDSLISETELLETAPILGFDAFRAVVVARSQSSLRLCCLGPRRCCSFLEGVARGLGEVSGESVRYMRQPQNATLVEILFKVFPQGD